ncbi:hypothetical protein CapIbe_008206 [Capra ibex]
MILLTDCQKVNMSSAASQCLHPSSHLIRDAYDVTRKFSGRKRKWFTRNTFIAVCFTVQHCRRTQVVASKIPLLPRICISILGSLMLQKRINTQNDFFQRR